MRLKKEQIAQIAHQVGENLKKAGCRLKTDEGAFFGKIEAIIQKNIQDELVIEDEVKKLMDQYRQQIASGAVDPQKAYQMIKKQVAKEKNFVL